MTIKREATVSITVDSATTRKDIQDFIEGVPDDAKLITYYYSGDRPWESSTVTLTFEWRTGHGN